MDSGCDQSIINIGAFRVISQSGIYYDLNGALQGRMQSSTALEVVDGATLVTFQDGSKVILIVNQALLDTHPGQTEALLQPHQARAHGCLVDECSKFHLNHDKKPGTQCVQTDKHTLPLYFDGLKTYFSISKPTDEQMIEYECVELTSPLPYEPRKRVYTRRRRTTVPCDKQLQEWRSRLGYPTHQVTRKTLDATTQMVQTVEAETREYMRDHFKPRLQMLRPHRVNDTLYTDTFFSSERSIRGFKLFQLFAYKHSGLDIAKLMKKKTQVYDQYEDIIREIGAPNYTVVDGAGELTGSRWTSINRKYCIEGRQSEPHTVGTNVLLVLLPQILVPRATIFGTAQSILATSA